jgi:hypothetical protein
MFSFAFDRICCALLRFFRCELVRLHPTRIWSVCRDRPHVRCNSRDLLTTNLGVRSSNLRARHLSSSHVVDFQNGLKSAQTKICV